MDALPQFEQIKRQQDTQTAATQWHDEGSGETKFENTEYQKEGAGKKNAYILLVMDMSQSLGENAEAARETAAWIVDYIANQM